MGLLSLARWLIIAGFVLNLSVKLHRAPSLVRAAGSCARSCPLRSAATPQNESIVLEATPNDASGTIYYAVDLGYFQRASLDITRHRTSTNIER
jgi:hypothetical protein